MLIVRITGNQLRAGRALADLSMEDLAARARLSRHSTLAGITNLMTHGLPALPRYRRRPVDPATNPQAPAPGTNGSAPGTNGPAVTAKPRNVKYPILLKINITPEMNAALGRFSRYEDLAEGIVARRILRQFLLQIDPQYRHDIGVNDRNQ
jgi:hypothetical protein